MKRILLLIIFINGVISGPYYESNKYLSQKFALWPRAQVFIYKSVTFPSFENKEPDCFGTLISQRHVLTTASCIMSTSDVHNYIITKVINMIEMSF